LSQSIVEQDISGSPEG